MRTPAAGVPREELMALSLALPQHEHEEAVGVEAAPPSAPFRGALPPTMDASSFPDSILLRIERVCGDANSDKT